MPPYFSAVPPFYPVPFASPNQSVPQRPPTAEQSSMYHPYFPFPGSLVSPAGSLASEGGSVPAGVPPGLSGGALLQAGSLMPTGAMLPHVTMIPPCSSNIFNAGAFQSLLFDVSSAAWRVPNFNGYFAVPSPASGDNLLSTSSSNLKSTSSSIKGSKSAKNANANPSVGKATNQGTTTIPVPNAVTSSSLSRSTKGSPSILGKGSGLRLKIGRKKTTPAVNRVGKSPVSVLGTINTPSPVPSGNERASAVDKVVPTNLFPAQLNSINAVGVVSSDANEVSKATAKIKTPSRSKQQCKVSHSIPAATIVPNKGSTPHLRNLTAALPNLGYEADSDVGSEAETCEDEEVVPPDEERDLQELGLQDAEQEEDHLQDDDYISEDEPQDSNDEAGYESPEELICDSSDESDDDSDDSSDDGSEQDQTETTAAQADNGANGPPIQRRWPKWVPAPDCRKPRNMGAIEVAMRNSKNRSTDFIFEPVLGMVFDSRAEAYQFYNLFSWEVGFGIRFGTSSRNRGNKYRTMQELVCEREGFDSRCTNSSKRVRCKAMIRLHRTEDHGWYVRH
ncbi:hypothetical protein EJB05_34944, partial [Eragrostis curvula]